MKPKTHVFLAEIALKDALEDGKVTIYATDYANGTVGQSIGDFDVDPDVLEALRSNAAQFRAGVLGPDAYPDIATGQQIIHPAGKDTPGQPEGVDINTGGPGSDPWLEYLYSRAFNGCNPDNSAPNPADQTIANQAFVLGYLAHAAADMYAHTLINYYAGGPFNLTPPLENAIKHMVMEGYIEKRTPSLSGNLYDATSIDYGVDQFIYRNMIDARPDSYLAKRLLTGSNTSFSLPAVFSTLRAQLDKDIQAYYVEKQGLSAVDKILYVTKNGPWITYKEAWRDDIDKGLAALPHMSDRLAKALFFNPNGMDGDEAKTIAEEYATGHLAAMQGLPNAFGTLANAVINLGRLIDYVLDLVNIRQIFKAMERNLLDFILTKAFGMGIDEIEKYAKDPAMLFAQNVILNEGAGQHIDISAFNAQQLHISDPSNTNPNEFLDYTRFAAAYNAVTMIKLALMSKDEVNRLLKVLTQKYDPNSTSPVLSQPNVMLGFMETLDGSNQWNANPNKMVLAQNPKLYQAIFMSQAGEVEPAPARVHELADATGQLSSFLLNGNPRLYYIGANSHVHELGRDGQTWGHRDLNKEATGNPVDAVANSALTGCAFWDLLFQPVGNRPHVYYVGVDKHIHELSWDGQRWWHYDLNKEATGATGKPVDAAANSALTSVAFAGSGVYVFYIGEDNHVHGFRSFAGASASWWPFDLMNTEARGNPVDAATGSALTSVALSNLPRAYYIGVDDHVHELWWDGQNWWHGDLNKEATGKPVDAVANSALTSVVLSGTSQQVYYIGGDRHVHEFWWGDGVGHNDLKNTVDAVADSALTGYVWKGNLPRVYYIGVDRYLHLLGWDGQNWAHFDLKKMAKGNPVPAAAGSGLTSFAESDTKTRLYYVGMDGHVHELGWNDGNWLDTDVTAMVSGS